MTLLCIIFTVFVVAIVLSMAEMRARMKQARLAEKHDGFSISALFNSTMGQTFLLSVGIIFLLILFAGVSMTSSNLSGSVARRTEFFGMIRCIGMGKKQIVQSARLEALDWCKTAVPIGLVLGVSASWILCGVLRYAAGEEFSNVSLLGVSIIGIVSDIIVGAVTVLLVTRSPANRVARVFLVAAVSGNSERGKMRNHTFYTRSIKIETAPSIHHAISAEKNLPLMTGSFALSIILSLSFTVLIDFVSHLIPQSVAISDTDISSSNGLNPVDDALAETLRGMNGIKQVYGRWGSFDISAEGDTGAMVSSTVGLVPFDDFDLDCLKKNGALRQGSSLSKVYGNSSYALAAWDKGGSWEIGDKILIGDEEIEIAGLLKYDPFSSNGLTNGKITLITSSQTFTRLIGITGYSFTMVQTTSQAADEDISQLCNIAAENGNHFSDRRDQHTSGTCLAFVLCIYYFLGTTTLVTVLSIVNSISMGVLTKIKQYGVMRAVGMDEQQTIKMIFAEALTYAFWGGRIGCAIGLPFSKMLYDFLTSDHFLYAVWSLSMRSLVIILLSVAFVAMLVAYAPARRIRNTSVTGTANEL